MHGLLRRAGAKKSRSSQDGTREGIYPATDTQTGYIHFQIKRENGCLNIVDSSFEGFAVIDTATAQKLEALGTEKIQLEAVVSSTVFSKRKRGSRQREVTNTFLLSVNVYGSRSRSSLISAKLSAVSAHLQHPYSLGPNIEYDNPHFFKPPGACVDMKQFVGDQESLSSRKSKLATELVHFLESLDSEKVEDELCFTGLAGLETKLRPCVTIAKLRYFG